ncbi:MAG: nitroreductase family protein [Candidatus Bathyarchaeota archaeon]|nr:nitroreductase family protein [Candidatus Bathyarchaeota archaeon]
MSKSPSLLDRVLSRRSIRQYAAQDIPDNVLNSILEAGRQAPSAMNLQPWHIIVITDLKLKQQLADGRYNQFITECPVTIIGCADTSVIVKNPYLKDLYETHQFSIVDVSIALQNMVIAAWALGVGSCWIGDFREPHVKSTFQIPDHWRVVALLTLGYPLNPPQSKTKQPFNDIISYNTFSSNR